MKDQSDLEHSLNQRQKAALEAAAGAGLPVGKSAEIAMVKKPQAAEYLRHADVLARLTGQRRRVVEDLFAQISGVAKEMMQTLIDIANDSELDENVRIRASTKVLDYLVKLKDSEALLAHVEKLAKVNRELQEEQRQVREVQEQDPEAMSQDELYAQIRLPDED